MIKHFSFKTNSWIKNHIKDYYVKESYKNNIRSRAWFKLKEIDEKENLFKLKHKIIDLGSAPGSWAQYAVSKIGNKGVVYAYDIKPMKPIKNVIFNQGDIVNDSSLLESLLNFFKTISIHVVMSDMSPNLTGVRLVDNVRSINLCNISLLIAKKVLKKNGFFLVKTFQGIELNQYINEIRKHFVLVKIYKPRSSRSFSRELYILASRPKKKN
ncbi:RlmE family RNA methyltransferase [Buchnera aphidicola]|uniref:RlmE family RNA methyltransferase n=1 Tax=Buchnera aphidicola TaxID=9 RepID=UPI003464DFDD